MKYITATPNIMGGEPVIKGTRIPMDVILFRLKEGYAIDEIHRMYPWVERKILEGAIDESINIIKTALHAKTVFQTQGAS